MSKDPMNLPMAAYPPELKILTNAAKERVLAAQKAQDYYDGKFWRHIEAQVAEWAEGMGDIHQEVHDYPSATRKAKNTKYTPSKLQLRYPKFFIDEIASWMFENPIGLDAEDENAYAILEQVHRDNKLDQKLLQSAGEGSLTGGIAVKVLWNPMVNKIRTIFVPSRECFPIPTVDDIDIIEKVHFCHFQDDDKTIWRQTFELRQISGKTVCWVIEALFNVEDIGDSSDPKPREIILDGPLYKDNTPIDFLPITLIPNEPNLGDIWGHSDLEPLYDPINEVCRKMSDQSDALKFELFPIALLLNIDESNTDEFEVSPGAVWKLMSGDENHPADAKKLESTLGSMAALEAYVDRLIGTLHQFSGVPNITRDKIDTTGAISGVAIKLMFTSIVSKCNRKMMYWKPGLEEVYTNVLKTARVYEGLKYDPDKLGMKISTTPRVPQNDLELLEIQAKEIEMLVKRVVTIMKERGVQNPEEELAAVLAERSNIDATFNPDLTGSRIAAEAEAPPGL